MEIINCENCWAKAHGAGGVGPLVSNYNKIWNNMKKYSKIFFSTSANDKNKINMPKLSSDEGFTKL